MSEVVLAGADGELQPASIRARIEAWVSQPAFQDLVARYGGRRRGGGDLEAYLKELDQFTETHWNFRANRERNLVDPALVTGSEERAVIEAATKMGMVTPGRPRDARYEFVLVLGGLVRACIGRPAYAAYLSRSLAFGRVDGLTAYRDLGGDEPELLRDLDLPSLSSEHEVMEAGMRRAFALPQLPVKDQSGVDQTGYLRWQLNEAEGRDFPVGLVVAPSGDADRRADSADTYRFWADRISAEPGQRVLLVTSTIYVPHQHVAAVRVLGLSRGLHIDTVGMDPDVLSVPAIAQSFRGVHYLQELRSAVASSLSLVRSLPG